ncbi:MAG: flagellar motor switch protein FliG [Polymorphobacter sp.]
MSAVTATGLTGAQKCAILVLLLEEAQAAELLRRMPPAEVRAVGEAMLSVAEIEPAAIDAVLDEFIARSHGVSALDSQGRQVRAVLSRALGRPRAARVIDHLGPPASTRRFAGFDWLDTPAIAALLADEHPQAVTVVLAHLPEAIAASVLDALPAPLQADLVRRLATLRPVAPAVIASLEADLEAKLAAAEQPVGAAALAGADFTARLIKLSSNKSALLSALAVVDEALAGEIAAQQFVFADLKALSTKDMQLVLREADPQTLSVAMKGADDELRSQIFAAMSSRAASQLQDELAERGPMKRAEVEAAQQAICVLVRRLGESGAVMMPGSAGAYV